MYALVVLFSRFLSPPGSRVCLCSHGTLAIRARHIYYRRRTVEANRRPKGRSVDINLAAREKKKREKAEGKGREGRKRRILFLLEEERPPTLPLDEHAKSFIFRGHSPSSLRLLRHLLYIGPDKPTVYRRRRFNPAMTNKLSA